MKILTLDREDSWHSQDLMRAAVDSNHQIEAIEYHNLSVQIPNSVEEQNQFSEFFGNGHELSEYDAILTRAMPGSSLEQIVFRMDWLDQIAFQHKILVINPAKTVEACVDKYLSLEKLRAMQIPVPATCVCQNAVEAMRFFVDSGCDSVVKPIFGSRGRDIERIQDEADAAALFQSIEAQGNVIYQQEYLEHGDSDLRLLVVGTVVYAMERKRIGHWVTNASLGAECSPYDATPAEADLAIAAAHSQNAMLAGVDIVYHESKPVVVEVNACPSWKTISAVSGHDIAKELLGLMEQLS